jgi:hypothetical protein
LTLYCLVDDADEKDDRAVEAIEEDDLAEAIENEDLADLGVVDPPE